MRYYFTCVSCLNEEILIIAKGNTPQEAETYLRSKYKVNKVLSIDTKQPTHSLNAEGKSYYAKTAGIHMSNKIRTSRSQRVLV